MFILIYTKLVNIFTFQQSVINTNQTFLTIPL